MTRKEMKRLEGKLTSYLEGLLEGAGRRERREAMGQYTCGLLLEGARKSIEPMAARLVQDEKRTEAMRQRLQQCITHSPWDDALVLGRLARRLEAQLPGVEALVLDDTGFKKQGTHSVGVAHQYSGTFHKVENCQLMLSLHLAGEEASAPIGFRLYLPEEWTQDAARRQQAGIPEQLEHEEKWRLGLRLVDEALEAGLGVRKLLADAAYGDVIAFREGLAQRGFTYFLGIKSTHVFWTARAHLTDERPLSAKDLALALGPDCFRAVSWREGSRGRQTNRFARLRVQTAADWHRGAPPGEEQWLLIEWPKGRKEPSRYWLSNCAPSTSLRQLVRQCKLRWRIEMDYGQLKEELGLDHFEGRSWRGLHHHATLCAVAYGFLALQRALFPPALPDVRLPASSAPSASAGPHPSYWQLPLVPPLHLPG
jgi:SRSO17 transposase